MFSLSESHSKQKEVFHVQHQFVICDHVYNKTSLRGFQQLPVCV